LWKVAPGLANGRGTEDGHALLPVEMYSKPAFELFPYKRSDTESLGVV
jgi:hypothetical protein